MDDYISSYVLLLEKLLKSTMKLAREILIWIEEYKTLTSLLPYFMQELFKLRKTKNSVLNKYKLNFPIASQVTYVTRSIRSFGPKIVNSVPYHIISAKNLGTFMKKNYW